MQLWTLIRFELKKTIGGKFFACIFLILLIVNIILWCGNWGYFGMGRKVTEFTKNDCAVLEELTPEKITFFENAMIQKYGEDVFNTTFIPTEEMMSPPGYFGEKYSDLGIVNSYVMLKEKNEIRESLYAGVLKAAKSFGRQALKEENDYEVRRNQSIIRLYSQPRAKSHYVVRCWDDFLFGNHTMLLVLLLVLQCCAGIFTKEIDQQTWLLLHTSKNGMGKTMVAKFLTAAICAGTITILFQGASLMTIYLNYGLLGISESVTGIQELELFPFLFSVGQYALLSIICQIFAAIVMAVLIGMISAFSKSSVISYVAGGLLLGGCIGLMFYPPRIEWLAGPLAMSRPERYFSSLYTANIMSYPVLWAVVQTVLWSTLAIGGILFSHRIYHHRRRKI